jgi:MYXO-CTERM domain-containing protein
VYWWDGATDPEGDALTYEAEVRDASGTLLGTVLAIEGTLTSTSRELSDGETYTWRVRAIDAVGAAGAYSAEQTFTVRLPTCCTSEAGCQAAGHSDRAGLVAAGLGLLGLVGLLGRPRRSRR